MALSLRHILIQTLRHTKTFSRTIMTSSTQMDKAVENLKGNPYFDKYAQKIATLQKTSPEEFLQRIEAHEKVKNPTPKVGSVDTRQYSSVLNPKEVRQGETKAEDKKLEDIFKIELVTDKDSEEIKVIWEEYHKNKEVIAASIPCELFAPIKRAMVEYPTFIFPLPRAQGYEFIMSQCYANAVHFTPLLAYQVHKENAPECLTMVHYTELTEKGLILMRGEYDKNVIDGKEAQCLANQFQLYYNGKDSRKTQFLHDFNKQADDFKHTDLISELENLTIG